MSNAEAAVDPAGPSLILPGGKAPGVPEGAPEWAVVAAGVGEKVAGRVLQGLVESETGITAEQARSGSFGHVAVHYARETAADAGVLPEKKYDGWSAPWEGVLLHQPSGVFVVTTVSGDYGVDHVLPGEILTAEDKRMLKEFVSAGWGTAGNEV